MDLQQKPSWSKGDLRRLGEALVINKAAAAPEGCPEYADVLRWHGNLAAEVAARIAGTSWATMPVDELSITARPKTVDTLVDKLKRQPTLKLGQVQDLAGVRVDADMTLTQQTKLAQEIAEHFGAPPKAIKDIRADPHSGYRAVHVWLALPAGRVEVQIRTTPQSEWANVYEGIGELVGRQIRYDQQHEHKEVQRLVDSMQTVSEKLAQIEGFHDMMTQVEGAIEVLTPPATPREAQALDQLNPISERYSEIHEGSKSGLETALDGLRELRRKVAEKREALRCEDS